MSCVSSQLSLSLVCMLTHRSHLLLFEAYVSINEDSEAAASTLVTRLAPNSVPLPPQTFERVLIPCIKNHKFIRAIAIYNCMTRRYGIAPSKDTYHRFTSMLAAVSKSDHITESLCYRLLSGKGGREGEREESERKRERERERERKRECKRDGERFIHCRCTYPNLYYYYTSYCHVLFQTPKLFLNVHLLCGYSATCLNHCWHCADFLDTRGCTNYP